MESGYTVSTSNNEIAITASDLALQGSINSGTARTVLMMSHSDTCGVGTTTGSSNFKIGGAEIQRISATGLVIAAGNCNRAFDSISNHGNGIYFYGLTAAHTNNIGGTVTIQANNNNGVEFITAGSTFNTVSIQVICYPTPMT